MLTRRQMLAGALATGAAFVGSAMRSAASVSADDSVPTLDAQIASPVVGAYANAYALAPESVQLDFKSVKDVAGNPFVVAIDSASGVPLLYADKDQTGAWNPWREASSRPLAEKLGIEFAGPVYYFSNRTTGRPTDLLQDAAYVAISQKLLTTMRLTGESNMSYWVFVKFTIDDWKNVLSNWDSVKQQLDAGQIPSGFPYNFAGIDRLVAFAKQNRMKIRQQFLLWGGDVPDAIFNGNFSSADIEKLAEFEIKTRGIKLKGNVDEYAGVGEAINSIIYHKGDKWTFWYDKLGPRKAMSKPFQWIREVDPNPKTIITEEHITEKNFPNPILLPANLIADYPELTQLAGYPRPRQSDIFLAILKALKNDGVPIDGVDIEHNLWIFDPFDKNFASGQLQKILDAGCYLALPEITVAISDVLPTWKNRPKVLQSVPDRIAAQNALYKDVADLYLQFGAGLGFGNWGDAHSFEKDLGGADAKAMMFDDNNQPKQCYYIVNKSIFDKIQSLG